MPWQHTLKADLHCHGPFNVTSHERYTSAKRKWRVYLQVQPSWDVETYGAGEKEIKRTLMWLFKVHWTTCDNSLSSCIYSFNVCSSLGDNCLNWCSKCYCFCVRREINSCGVPLCMSGCLIFFSMYSYFHLSPARFPFFIQFVCLLACVCVFYYLSLSCSHFLISKAYDCCIREKEL